MTDPLQKPVDGINALDAQAAGVDPCRGLTRRIIPGRLLAAGVLVQHGDGQRGSEGFLIETGFPHEGLGLPRGEPGGAVSIGAAKKTRRYGLTEEYRQYIGSEC